MSALSITAIDVHEVSHIESTSGPAGEALTAGQFTRLNTTTGHWELGKATSAAECHGGGIALNDAAIGRTVTVLKQGIVDLGNALSALSYDDDVYLNDTDGTLEDATGTVEKLIGTVVPGMGATTADKLLRVDL